MGDLLNLMLASFQEKYYIYFILKKITEYVYYMNIFYNLNLLRCNHTIFMH